MKRSEAMDMLQSAFNMMKDIRDMHGRHYLPEIEALHDAARDLLNAEDDLPWKVSLIGTPLGATYNPPELMASFRGREAAEYVAKFWGDYYTRITGPTQIVDHGEDEQACVGFIPAVDENGHGIPGGQRLPYDPKYDDYSPEFEGDPDDVAFCQPVSNPYKLPRLVPVETKRPTLDQFDGQGQQLCEQHGDIVFRMNVGGEVFRVKPDGSQGTPVKKYTPSAYRVLGADPIGPKTVGELELGMVIHDDDAGWLVNLGYADNFWQVEKSRVWKLPKDTPITGPVYRFEITD